MQLQKKVTVTGASAILALAVAICVGLCYCSLRFTRATRNVLRQYLVLDQIYRARSSMHEAASHVLRYDITHDPRFLRQFNGEMDEIGVCFSSLDTTIIDPDQRVRLRKLRSLYAGLRESWTANTAHSFERQKREITSPALVRPREEFNDLVEEMVVEEYRLLNATQDELGFVNMAVLTSGLLNLMLTVFVTAFVVGTLWQELKRRDDMLAFTDQLAKTYGGAPGEEKHGTLGP